MILTILTAFLGGGIGAALRYLLSLVLPNSYLILVNLTGAFLAGIAITLLQPQNTQLKILIITGILGGFTTFSSFSIELLNIANDAKYISLITNIIIHTLGSLACCALGVKIATIF